MKTILFYGDSNTYGYDPRSYIGGRYPAEVRWTDRLREQFKGEWNILVNAMNGREIPVDDAGIGRVIRIIRTAADNAGQSEAVYFAVMLGTNDLFSAFGASKAVFTASKMKQFLDRIISAVPDIRILLIAPPLIGSSNYPDKEIQLLFRESRQLSLLYHIISEQLSAAFASAADWDLQLAADGVHLTEKDNAVFAEKMAGVIDSLE